MVILHKTSRNEAEKMRSFAVQCPYNQNSSARLIRCSKDHVEKEPIREWLAGLEYPLYYLDYETLMPAIPLLNGTRPFQQVPFQFSLHVQERPNAELKHFEFIHKEQSEPREAFAKGNISPEQLHILWKNLSEYCKLDT